MNKNYLIIALLLIIGACSKSEVDKITDTTKPVVKQQISGKIEKGPFLTGSKISLYELDEKLRQTGKNTFRTETVNDNGEFLFDSKMELATQFVELEISGFFFNEVEGENSRAQITLNAISDISAKNKINVNILTHLEYKRIKKLVADGAQFSKAKEQAQKELLEVFHITSKMKDSDAVELSEGNDDAAILLAISAMLLHNKSEADFSEFIAKLSNDFAASGEITNDNLLEDIHQSQRSIFASNVMKNLEEYYKQQGRDVKVENIKKYIDHNNDGVLDEEDANYDDEPKDNNTSDIFGTTEEEVQAVINHILFRKNKYFEDMLVLDAVRSELIGYAMNINPDNQQIYDSWSNSYRAMHLANSLIERENLPFVPPYLPLTKVIRSILYLDMAQHWGDVPLVTKVLGIEDLYIPRTDINEIYSFILNDLTALDISSNGKIPAKYTTSQDLIDAVIGLTYLEKKDYKSASAYFEKIFERDADIYIGEDVYTNANHKEHLFRISFDNDNTPSALFEEYIKRGEIHPIYRRTGAMLHYAEALLGDNRTADMIDVINKVRIAANMGELKSPLENPKKEIAALWLKAIGSDYGYFSLLKRLGLAVSELGINEYEQLYPIPRRELMVNPYLSQNPYY